MFIPHENIYAVYKRAVDDHHENSRLDLDSLTKPEF